MNSAFLNRLNFLPNTLASRLFILSSLAAIIGVLIVAFVISAEYRRNSEARLNEVLVANIFNLMGTFEVDKDGQLMGLPDLGDIQAIIGLSKKWGWHPPALQVFRFPIRL